MTIAIGWNTNKTVIGDYHWQVTAITYGEPEIVLEQGIQPTRAKATQRAKKWALRFRRASTLRQAAYEAANKRHPLPISGINPC